MVTATLLCHPVLHCPQITNFSAQLESLVTDRLLLRMHLDGAIDELLIPEKQKPDFHGGHGAHGVRAIGESGRTDGLWKHTCFEAFLRVDDNTYYEFNFSPAGQWAAYAFTGYRSGMREIAVAAPRIDCSQTTNDLDIEVEFQLPTDLANSAGLQRPSLAVSLAAVIEDRAEVISYWAVTHTLQKPDFHHRDSFTVRLPHHTAV